MIDAQKQAFVRTEFIRLIRTIKPDAPAAWGKMNAQQMIEHMSESIRVANGKEIHTQIISPPENLPKMKAFIMSEVPFKENTKSRMLAETPKPLINANLQDAIDELQKEVNDFFTVFDNEPDKIILNPIFGELNYNEWTHLLYKHCNHHLKQFGLV